MLVADAHVDLLLELHHRRHRLGETGAFARTWLPLLERGGVGLQVCPVYVDVAVQPEGALREALAQVAALHAAVAETPGRVCHVRRRSDLDVVAAGERIGLLLALEGVEPFGLELWPVDVFAELGVRMASLTWNRRNAFADGAAETGGLSSLGRRLVDRLVRAGVAIDLAHASPATFDEVLEASGEAPVLVSHAACRAVYDHPRNLADTQLRALASRGGVLGVMLHPLALGTDAPTIERACEHLEHAVEVMGVEGVALGGDFAHRLARELPPAPEPADGLAPAGLDLGAAVEGLAGPEDYPALVSALRARGWREDDLRRVLGANLLAFLRRALPT